MNILNYFKREKETKVDPKTWAEDRVLEVMPYFGPISYKDLKEHVLPIVTTNELLAGREADSDQKLPSYVQRAFATVRRNAKIKIDAGFVMGVWFLARIITNYRRFRTLSGDSNLFRKDVVLTGLLIGVPTYPFAWKYLSTCRVVYPDPALMAIKNDHQLSLYRKRLIEFKPEYANKRYRVEKGLASYDGFDFSEHEKKANQKELIEDKDVFDEEGEIEGELGGELGGEIEKQHKEQA